MVGEKDAIKYPNQKREAIKMLKESTNQQAIASIVLATTTTKKPKTPARKSTKTPTPSVRRTQPRTSAKKKENAAPTPATRPVKYDSKKYASPVYVEAHLPKKSIENSTISHSNRTNLKPDKCCCPYY
jgi:hypothetical protein